MERVGGIPPQSLAVARSFVVAGCVKHPPDACRSLATPRSADLRLSSLQPSSIPQLDFHKTKTRTKARVFVLCERVGGIEPPSSAWKADIKAIIRYPQQFNLIRKKIQSQDWFSGYKLSFIGRTKIIPEAVSKAENRKIKWIGRKVVMSIARAGPII